MTARFEFRKTAAFTRAGFFVLALIGAFAAPATAAAEDASQKATIDIQLNAAQPSGEGCRVSFVLRNRLQQRIEDLTFEVVLFDASGSVAEFLLLKAGSLPTGKIRVRQFDLKDHKCEGLSQVLLNDVKVCTGEGLTASGCLDLLRPSSAAPIKLVM